MLIKTTVSLEWKGVMLSHGTVLTLPDREARELIRRKLATPLFNPRETGTVTPEDTR